MSHFQHGHSTGSHCFVRSYAKINVTLDVLGRRADGYHELATIMQTIDLYDTLCLSATDEDRVRIVCTQAELNTQENLAVRAAQALRKELGLKRGVTIELHKRIPVAAGLAGGSSNAAAVLLALQQWWQLQLSPSDMLTLAASLGSDVPFFLTGGLALCEGRGERVTPLAARWPASLRWLLLVKPAIGISTAAVFRALPASDYTDGRYSRAVCAALQSGSELQLADLHNGLERGVLAQYPQVAQARAALLDAGAPFVRLSGSGPTLFAPFADLAHATQVQQLLHAQGYTLYLTRATHPNVGDVCSF
jgi:4-diphosphocytidyl-2-C-methyl-D-erythritol kinase